MKYTKNCLLPWSYMLIHAGGLMQTCPCGSDIEIGDFILDYCEKKQRGEETDIFNSSGLKAVRAGLLTGDMREMCRNCAFKSFELITTEELKLKLIQYLESRNNEWTYQEGMDLTEIYSYQHLGISLSNRCNLRCMYCNQSTCAETNPFYKMDFPEEFLEDTMAFIASQNIDILTASVEGEATIFKNWYRIYKDFIDKNPQIKVYLTTNLNKHYSDEEIELLARHATLDISCDTLDSELYGKIRVNGNLELLLENLKRIEDTVDRLQLKRPDINIHVVVCNLTWESLPEIAEFAITKKYHLNIGNYEERLNALGYQTGMLKTIYTLPFEQQEKIRNILDNIKHSMDKAGLNVIMNGDILHRVEASVARNYHRFIPAETDYLNYRYYEKNLDGTAHQHLDIVYDYDNIAYPGILSKPGASIEIDGLDGINKVSVREVFVYEPGKHSTKYNQKILPGYRRLLELDNGKIVWTVSCRDDVEKVLVMFETI